MRRSRWSHRHGPAATLSLAFASPATARDRKLSFGKGACLTAGELAGAYTCAGRERWTAQPHNQKTAFTLGVVTSDIDEADKAGLTTAGAAMAHLDLALSVVRGRSPALAARYLLVEARGSQAEFVIPDHLAHADAVLERFESWARWQLANGFSLVDEARTAGASERTLARRLHRVLGKTPLSYFQDLHIERALHLLRTGTHSVDRIAAQIGDADGVTLRTLLRRKLGRGVRELRSRA